jgi:hypothetical protein
VRNTNANITPSGRDRLLIADSEVGEGQDGADEVGGLLVQVVEVLGGPLDVGRQHLLHAGLGQGRVHVHFVLREGGEALGVHPALHDEGPEVEGYWGAVSTMVHRLIRLSCSRDYIPKGASRGAATPIGALLRKDMACVCVAELML